MKRNKLIYIFLVGMMIFSACNGKKPQNKSYALQKSQFVADSAYRYISLQVAFGPRVIGTEAHSKCVDYLANQLQQFGFETHIQQGKMLDYADNLVEVKNIIGRINPDVKNRVLLAAHYDSRPWADNDANYDVHNLPILGANDGASGVGVLLEIARQLNQTNSSKGIDIVFFDAEDMGAPQFYTGKEKENDWCLGSQFWASEYSKNKNEIEYQYGIVLDMVGAGDAVFPNEYFSMQYAAEYVNQLWQTALQLGYGNYFVKSASYPITDDHFYVNKIAGIPCVDIIHYTNPSGYGQSGFCSSWHTLDDNMSVISTATLDAVGSVVATFINK